MGSKESSELEEYLSAFDDDEIREIARASLELHRESPRGAVLILASLLDIRLENLLRAVLENNKSTEDLFRAANAPLSSLSSKINLAHSLRLITDDESSNLHLARKVRNVFAHQVSCSFEDAQIRDRVSSLDYRLEALDQSSPDPRHRYQLACTALIMNLYNRWKAISDRHVSNQPLQPQEIR